MVTCSEEKRKRRRTSWDFGGYFTPFLVSSHSPHPMADQMLGWLVVPKYGIMYENPMKLGRMMNGIQGIPRVTTQGCGFFNGFIWVGPKLLQFCSWRINESNPRCTVTSLKLPSLCWDLKKGVGMGVFFSASRGVSLIVTSWGPQMTAKLTNNLVNQGLFWGYNYSIHAVNHFTKVHIIGGPHLAVLYSHLMIGVLISTNIHMICDFPPLDESSIEGMSWK